MISNLDGVLGSRHFSMWGIKRYVVHHVGAHLKVPG